jgi:tetratricopeptide (TPR) repeat protein
MLQMTTGWAASETVDARERTVALAEKSGNLTQLGNSLWSRGFTAWASGDFSTASALADQTLELALREGNPAILAYRHMLQMIVHFSRSDIVGAEHYFTTGLKFIDDPDFRQAPMISAVGLLNYGTYIAWTLGRADVARERCAQMMAAARANNPQELAFAGHCAAMFWLLMREYEQAEALAARALELSEKHLFPNEAAMSRCPLGRARAQLGRTTEGIALIRQGIAGGLAVGQRVTLPLYGTYLAEAQEREGGIADALETTEQTLRTYPDELSHRPETLRLRGELWLKQGHTELAEAGFRESIALAQTMSAKSWELRTTMSLARLLAKYGRRDEGHAMLVEIYAWFTEGFDTADLKDAKALLDGLKT